MKFRRIIRVKLVLILLLFASCKNSSSAVESERFTSFIVNPQNLSIQFYWKTDSGQILKSIQNLKNYVEAKGKHLRFATNGGIYETGNQPKGLFIQNQQVIKELDTADGGGNFHLKPNGVFYLTTDNRAFITQTQNFKNNGEVKFATQSGPMLVIDGNINPQFTESSSNLYVRNGVGILPDNTVVFAISQQKVSLYEFADYFKNLNCREALYLDGFVSRMYLPEKKIEQLDGDFAVIIGVIN